MWHTSRVALVSWATFTRLQQTTPMQSECLHHPHHTQVHAHRVVGHFTFEMVLSPELLEGCKGKKKVPVNVVNHHLNEDVPVKRLGALPRLLRLCADAREDVKSVLPTCFSV